MTSLSFPDGTGTSWGCSWGRIPHPQVEETFLNLERCVAVLVLFKLAPRTKEEWMYTSLNYFLLVQLSLELPSSQMEEP